MDKTETLGLSSSVQGLALPVAPLLLLGGGNSDLDLVWFCDLGETPNLCVLDLPSREGWAQGPS